MLRCSKQAAFHARLWDFPKKAGAILSNDPNRRKPNKPQPGGDDENRKARRIVVLIVAALIATLLINSLYTTISNAYLTEITYTEFK